MNIATTQGISVIVEAQFQPTHSQPIRQNFIFTYRITIQNQSSDAVQLLRRHWIIGDNCIAGAREVRGDGVIGQMPILQSGEQFEYQSWTEMHSDIGQMRGSFTMKRLSDGALFDIEIPKFILLYPPRLN